MYRFDHKMSGSFAAWVAILAVVLNALWPLMAQVKPDMAAMQMEGCDGSMQHSEAAGGGPAPTQPSPLMPHCAFCTLVAGGFTALVADGVIIVGSIDAKETRLALPEARPVAYFSYSFAQSRAPPALS